VKEEKKALAGPHPSRMGVPGCWVDTRASKLVWSWRSCGKGGGVGSRKRGEAHYRNAVSSWEAEDFNGGQVGRGKEMLERGGMWQLVST